MSKLKYKFVKWLIGSEIDKLYVVYFDLKNDLAKLNKRIDELIKRKNDA